MSSLKEYLVCEIKVGKKNSFNTALYRSPGQSIEELVNLNNNNNNPCILFILIGNFNASNSN